MSDPISAHIQRAYPGVEIEMFDIDLTKKGGDIVRFSNWVLENGNNITWRGHDYIPVAMEASGYAIDGSGKVVRPKMKIGNGIGSPKTDNMTLSEMAMAYDDFVGCEVTRWKTYRQYLDDQLTADPARHFPIERYRVSSKTNENPLTIEWELGTTMDQEGKRLPSGIMMQKHCRFTYRRWSTGASDWNYANVQCPYEGGAMFDRNDEPTVNPQEDYCSRRVSGCRARFGTSAPLPLRAFPGMVRLTRGS